MSVPSYYIIFPTLTHSYLCQYVIVFLTNKPGMGTIIRKYSDGVFPICNHKHLEINFELDVMKVSRLYFLDYIFDDLKKIF